MRYTVSTADARIIRHVDSTVASKDSSLSMIYARGFLRSGSRSLVLVPARWFNRAASDFAIYVLDISVLPCPPGTIRNDTSFPGNAYPNGACYPTATWRPAR